jgi:hypothetical protein
MNNKQKMYLGVFIFAVVVLGIMYSMGTFSKSSLMAFSDTGMVEMRPNIMTQNSDLIGGLDGRITTNQGSITANQGSITANRGSITANQGSIATNQASIGTKTNMQQLTDAIDGAEELASADRNAIKNFVRSKAVLFNPADYNKQGQATISNLINKQITTPVLKNDNVF